jgi:HEAT repeat protein
MKKIIILAVVFLMTAAFVNAQEAEKKESGSESTVNSEDVKASEPVNEVEKKSAETKKEEPAKPSQGKDGYIADLSSNDENKIVAAAEWLGEKEEKSAVPQLVDLLKNDKRTKVRLYATIALALISDESCIPTLNDALTGDSSADVRYAVLLAIHRINPAKSLDALKKAKETESDPYIKDYIEKMENKWKGKK